MYKTQIKSTGFCSINEHISRGVMMTYLFKTEYSLPQYLNKCFIYYSLSWSLIWDMQHRYYFWGIGVLICYSSWGTVLTNIRAVGSNPAHALKHRICFPWLNST